MKKVKIFAALGMLLALTFAAGVNVSAKQIWVEDTPVGFTYYYGSNPGADCLIATTERNDIHGYAFADYNTKKISILKTDENPYPTTDRVYHDTLTIIERGRAATVLPIEDSATEDTPPHDTYTIECNEFYKPAPAPKEPEKENTGSASHDSDTYKSEEPAKTLISRQAGDGKSTTDIKIHSSSERSCTNQEFLANYFAKQSGRKAKIILTKDIFPRTYLTLKENGEKRQLVWNNPDWVGYKTVYAVIYNQTDGAYLIKGMVDATGCAVFEGYIYRPASTITIFAME